MPSYESMLQNLPAYMCALLFFLQTILLEALELDSKYSSDKSPGVYSRSRMG